MMSKKLMSLIEQHDSLAELADYYPNSSYYLVELEKLAYLINLLEEEQSNEKS